MLLGYALCSNGLVGLTARHVPLVVPRAHDCITLFLGSKERYLDYFQKHPGVYFKTSGWIERGEGLTQYHEDSIQYQAGMTQTYDELVAKYGEDNAKFLYEQLCNMMRNYIGLTFIEMGIEPDDRFERQARGQAAERGWTFEKLAGDMTLIQRLVDGPWDADRFLVVPPGGRVAASFDENIVRVESLSGTEQRKGDSKVTGHDRILAVLAGAPADSLPLMPITMMLAADQIGVPYGKYATDHRVLVEGQIRTAEKFDFDHVSCISDPAREAADCGAAVQYFDNQPPAVDETRSLLADKDVLRRLKVPDPMGWRTDARPRPGRRVVSSARRRPKADRGLDRRSLRRGRRPARHQPPDDRFLRRPGLCPRPVRFHAGHGTGVRPGAGRGGRGHNRRGRRRRLAGRPENLRRVRAALREAGWSMACTRWARGSGCTSAATSAASCRASAAWAATWSTSTRWFPWTRRGGKWARRRSWRAISTR